MLLLENYSRKHRENHSKNHMYHSRLCCGSYILCI